MGLILSLDNSIHSFNTGKFVLDQYTGAAAAYSLRRLSVNTTNVVRVRRSSDNAEADFTADEITDGTLLSWVGGVNLLLFSEQFDNPYYFKNLGTLTTNQTTAPDGSLTADLFTKTSGVNTVSELRVGGVYSSTGIHTYSIYVKQNVGDNVLIRLDLVGNTANATFNFSTKTISTVGANAISATATELSDGWFRLSLTGNVTSTAWSISIINLFTNPTNDSVYVWGAQLNEGATAGDYAPTTSNISGYGYVTTWYDQAGSNNATQATAAAQPQIVDGGSLITQGGKASIDFGTISENKCLTVNTSSITNNLITIVHNITYKSNKNQVLLALSDSNYIIITAVDAGKLKYVNSNDDMISTTNVGSFQLSTIDINDGKLYTNNLEEDNVTTASGATSRYVIGNYTSTSGNELEGYVSEIVTWQTAQTSNRASIEGNINGHYNIYP